MERTMIKLRILISRFHMLILLFWCLVLTGCFNNLEGEFVHHWIGCSKSEAGKWVTADRFLFNRFNIVYKSRYRVSFANQRVVSSIGLELKDCTVYDRNNWNCKDRDGSLFAVEDGQGPYIGCSKIREFCFNYVNRINRVVILFRGVKEADRLCGISSESFEMIRNFQL